MLLKIPTPDSFDKIEPLLIEFGQVPSNIYVYPGILSPILIGFLFLFGTSVYSGLCVAILKSKLLDQKFQNFKINFLISSVIILVLSFLITFVKAIIFTNLILVFLIVFMAVEGVILVLKLFFEKSNYEVGLTIFLFGFFGFFSNFLLGQTSILHRYIHDQTMIDWVYLLSLYILPFAAIMLYRRKDPKFNKTLPYKFISLCLFVTFLCLVIPMIDMLVADHGAE